MNSWSSRPNYPFPKVIRVFKTQKGIEFDNEVPALRRGHKIWSQIEKNVFMTEERKLISGLQWNHAKMN